MSSDSGVHLYLRAGGDGCRVSACPLGHAVHMCSELLLQRRAITQLHVHTVPQWRPPPGQFASHGLRRVPALIDADYGRQLAAEGADEVLRVLGDRLTPLERQANHEDSEHQSAALRVFSRFCQYMRCLLLRSPSPASGDVSVALRRLSTELERVNAYLTEAARPFLSGAAGPGRLDCELMPKLHHVRVACERLGSRELLPSRLTALWRYLYTAYSLECFTSTCPCDQEIELHWSDRAGFPPLTYDRHKTLCRQSPAFSLHVLVRAEPVLVDQSNGRHYSSLCRVSWAGNRRETAISRKKKLP